MNERGSVMHHSKADGQTAGHPRPQVWRPRARWLVVLALILLVAGAWAVWSGAGGAGGPADTRASQLIMNERDVAMGGPASNVRSTYPPVDVDAVERGAKAASLGAIPLPASQQVESFVVADPREQVTQAVLVYDDLNAAASLDRLAAPLLGSAFGLMSERFDLQGASDARLWTGQGYQVATFRLQGVIMLVATTSADPARIRLLAEVARDKAQTALAATAQAAGTRKALGTPDTPLATPSTGR
jgi:hypothetical protein